MTLVGNELVKVTGITPTGGPSGQEEQCTTADIANLTPGSSGANPSATAGPTAVNGSALAWGTLVTASTFSATWAEAAAPVNNNAANLACFKAAAVVATGKQFPQVIG